MNKNARHVGFFILLASLLSIIASCGGHTTATYPISASVNGVVGTLVLTDGMGSPLTVQNDGQSSFSTNLPNGYAYTISVETAPQGQHCVVSNASGTIQNAGVNVSVSCATTGTATSLDTALPSSLASAITQVVTPFGSASLDSTVPVDLSGSAGVTIAIGFDANQQIRVAALVSSPQTEFTADSTALALARLASADVDTNQSEKTIESELRASASYASLASAIQTDLQNGSIAMSDSAVVKNLAAVVADAIPKIASASKRPASKAVVTPEVSALPYTILSGFQITSLGAQDIGLDNGTRLPWDVSTSVSTAAILIPSETPLTYVPMGNSPFNVTITQDATAKGELAHELATDVIKGVMLFMPSSCTGAVIGQINEGLQESVASSAQSFQEFQSDWKGSISKVDVAALVKQCVPSSAASLVSEDLTLLLEAAGSVIDDVAGIGEIIGAASAVAQLNAAGQYWGQSFTAGVCATYDYQIQSCTASFTASPATLTMAPGATEAVTYASSPPGSASAAIASFSAFDSTGAPTVTPADLEFESDNSDVSVTASNDGYPYPPSFSILAVNTTAGLSATISITDPSTGAASAPLSVSVIDPLITPDTQTVVSGTQQTVSFSLT
ncbi:MAG: hypothetical protein WB439_10720, partial [Acidobacteriaceae bacterium]